MRKRERFERSDVPRENPYRPLIGLAVIALVVMGVAATILLTWNRAKNDSRLGDIDMTIALNKKIDVDLVQEAGWHRSQDDFVNFLIPRIESFNQNALLQQVRVLSVNSTAGTAALLELSADTQLVASSQEPADSGKTLAELYAKRGFDEFSYQLAQMLNLNFDHVVITTQDLLEAVRNLTSMRRADLIKELGPIVSQIRSDMDPSELFQFASMVRSISEEDVAKVELPYGDDGKMNTIELARRFGFLVVDAQPENEEGEASSA